MASRRKEIPFSGFSVTSKKKKITTIQAVVFSGREKRITTKARNPQKAMIQNGGIGDNNVRRFSLATVFRSGGSGFKVSFLLGLADARGGPSRVQCGPASGTP